MLYVNELTYRIFEMIEERGLQFVLPKEWKPLYQIYLKQKKINKLMERIEEIAEKYNAEQERDK